MIIKNPKFEISAVGPKQYPKGELCLWENRMSANRRLLILC